jgi:hypothetical protein
LLPSIHLRDLARRPRANMWGLRASSSPRPPYPASSLFWFWGLAWRAARPTSVATTPPDHHAAGAARRGTARRAAAGGTEHTEHATARRTRHPWRRSGCGAASAWDATWKANVHGLGPSSASTESGRQRCSEREVGAVALLPPPSSSPILIQRFSETQYVCLPPIASEEVSFFVPRNESWLFQIIDFISHSDLAAS